MVSTSGDEMMLSIDVVTGKLYVERLPIPALASPQPIGHRDQHIAAHRATTSPAHFLQTVTGAAALNGHQMRAARGNRLVVMLPATTGALREEIGDRVAREKNCQCFQIRHCGNLHSP